MKLLSLFFGNAIWRMSSFFIAWALRIRGIRVGKNFYAEGIPIIKISGAARNIEIGDGVRFVGTVDIRNRENGKIRIGNGCKIDQGVRFVAANDALLDIGAYTNIGAHSIFNCGADVTIGDKCLIAGFVYIQSSNHGIRIGMPIKEQPHTHEAIVIGDDVWLGGHVSVLQGAQIGTGAVVGAQAVVTGKIESNSVAYGVPAKTMRFRT